jgi:hypothetical protein
MPDETACLVCGAPAADVPAASRLPFNSTSAVEFLAQFCVIDADVFRELQSDIDGRRMCKSCHQVLTNCDQWSRQLEQELEKWRLEVAERRSENTGKGEQESLNRPFI